MIDISTDQIDRALSLYRSDKSSSSSPAVGRGRAGPCTAAVQIQPRKCMLDHVLCIMRVPPGKKNELDDATSRTDYLSALKCLDHCVWCDIVRVSV